MNNKIIISTSTKSFKLIKSKTTNIWKIIRYGASNKLPVYRNSVLLKDMIPNYHKLERISETNEFWVLYK